VATKTLLAGVLRREFSSKLARLTAGRLAALANPSGQDASPRRVHQSTYLTSTRLESFEFLRTRRKRETRLTALLPLRLASLAAHGPRAFAIDRLAPEDARAKWTRVARCPYRRLLREAASSAPRGGVFGRCEGE
jgi:hypothetical protein